MFAVALSVWFCWPVLSSGRAFGINDWDMNLFYVEAARRSLAQDHQFPLWNPWYCGGSSLLANPQSVALSPLFVLDLLFGSVIGTKIGIALAQAAGIIGVGLLAHRAGARPVAAALGGVVYATSSVFTLHVATGHATWVTLGMIPYALLGATASIEHARRSELHLAVRYGALGSVALACVLFAGNAYFFVYTTIAIALWSAIDLVADREPKAVRRALGAATAVIVFAWSLSAIKLLPMLDFLGRVGQYEARDESGATFEALGLALLSRDQGLLDHALPGMRYRWWEYGAYVGLLPFLAAITGGVARFRAQWRWIALGGFFALLAMGVHGPVWPALRALPGFDGLRVPSRTIVYVVLAFALFAALGVSWLSDLAERTAILRTRGALYASCALVVLVGVDVALVTRPALERAFVLPAAATTPTPQQFSHRYGHHRFETFARYSNTFDFAVRNQGMLNCYERLHLGPAAPAPPAVVAATVRDRHGPTTSSGDPPQVPNPAYRGEVWLEHGGGSVSLDEFSPNAVRVRTVGIALGDPLVLDQNFDPGWRAEISSPSGFETKPTRSSAGLVAVDLPAGATSVRFSYRPRNFVLGAVVSVLAMIGLAGATLVRRRRRGGAGAES